MKLCKSLEIKTIVFKGQRYTPDGQLQGGQPAKAEVSNGKTRETLSDLKAQLVEARATITTQNETIEQLRAQI